MASDKWQVVVFFNFLFKKGSVVRLISQLTNRAMLHSLDPPRSVCESRLGRNVVLDHPDTVIP